MRDRAPFRFLAAAVSGQSHQRGQGHWQRPAATDNPISIALKMAASSLRLSDRYWGAQFRRLRAKLGTPLAIKAMAAKLARLAHRTLRYGIKYVDQAAAFYVAQHRHLQIRHRKFKAASIGYQLIQISAA